MSTISTHVLDTALGRPAAGVAVLLELETPAGGWQEIARGITNADGRLAGLAVTGAPQSATLRLTFETGAYFRAHGAPEFFPRVMVLFTVSASAENVHVPLLLSAYGYSTYRGS
jgi:5-hydroxyisourate hydrolase